MAGIQAEHISREYIMGRNVICAVDDISFAIPEGKYTIILGASGAGKSTVLNMLGGMDSPTAGSLVIGGGSASASSFSFIISWRTSPCSKTSSSPAKSAKTRLMPAW